MKLTGLLLGAGASFDIGMPLANELDRDLKRIMTPEKLRSMNFRWKAQFAGVSDDAIEELIRLLGQQGLNYEHIIGNFEVRSQGTRAEEGYSYLRASMSEWVYLLLLEWHENNREFIKRNIGLLSGIKELSRMNSPLWVFSLNQDLIIECFSAHSGIPLRCGFTGEIERLPLRDIAGEEVGNLDALLLPSGEVDSLSPHFFKSGEEGINLLKIHGSLDVFSVRNGRDFLKLIPGSSGVDGVIDTLLVANESLRPGPDWPDREIRALNEIMYADQHGEVQFLRRTPLTGAFKFREGYSQVIPEGFFSNFKANLNHLSKLISVGYSFGDLHVNLEIREWLETDGERCLIIVDPYCSHIPEPFLHLTPQVEIALGATATEYLDQIGCITRSNSEKLDRKLSAWVRRDPHGRKDALSKFLERKTEDVMEGATQWVCRLPMRDGDLDLDAMGLNIEGFLKLSKEQNHFPSWEELVTEFLREVGNLPEGQED